MPSEKQKIPLIVESDHLTALKLGHWWEHRLEHPADCVT